MRMLTAFPTARGLARCMQQAATDQRNGALTGKVGTALTATRRCFLLLLWGFGLAGTGGLVSYSWPEHCGRTISLRSMLCLATETPS